MKIGKKIIKILQIIKKNNQITLTKNKGVFMGITIKNFPKDLDPDAGDVFICSNGFAWIVAEDESVVCLENGALRVLDEIKVVKVFSNCELKLG
jgi:hypothetical protein